MIAHQGQHDLALLAFELQPVKHGLCQFRALHRVIAAATGFAGVVQQ